jgi:hypothetical protein
MAKPNTRKRYATANNPSIAAVLNELFRFPEKQDAELQLAQLAQHFIHSRQQIRNEDHPSIHLWIKGYAVSDEDAKQGVIGHFAVVSYKQIEGRYTLYATKVPTEAKLHPQRAQIGRDNPNWGHPVLRAVRKKKNYATLEEAEAELALLHAQFPRVSIPNPNKLYIMIYCANRPAKERMVKQVLEIKVAQEGGYYIECKENIRTSSSKTAKPQPEGVPPPHGYFTAKVALKRRRKQSH